MSDEATKKSVIAGFVRVAVLALQKKPGNRPIVYLCSKKELVEFIQQMFKEKHHLK